MPVIDEGGQGTAAGEETMQQADRQTGRVIEAISMMPFGNGPEEQLSMFGLAMYRILRNQLVMLRHMAVR